MNKEGKVDEKANIVFRSKPIPQQGFSLSKRIPTELSDQIGTALMSADGHVATAVVRKRFGGSKDLMLTNRDEYQGYTRFLRDFWGFEVPESEIVEDGTGIKCNCRGTSSIRTFNQSEA